MEHRILIASDGMVYTNGSAYGKEIYLGINDAPENWCEITDTEYQAITEAETAPDEETIPLSLLESAYRKGVESL